MNIIHSMAILILHSLKIFFLGGSPIIPDFVATLFSNHIGNVFKTVWLEPLFFCPLSTDRARKWDTFSAILKAVFLCYALVDANLSISHFCENCLCNVIFLLSQQISCPLQSTPFWVVRKQSVSWHFNRKTVSVERNKIFFFFFNVPEIKKSICKTKFSKIVFFQNWFLFRHLLSILPIIASILE